MSAKCTTHTVCASYIHTFSFIALLYILILLNFLDSLLNITLQPSGFNQNTVGQRQDVICSISVPPNVDPDTVELGWLNENDIITDDSRVTINTSSDYFNDSTLVTVIQFDPLTEEDEDEYICYAMINGSYVFNSIILQNITSKLVRHRNLNLQNMYICMLVHKYMQIHT